MVDMLCEIKSVSGARADVAETPAATMPTPSGVLADVSNGDSSWELALTRGAL